MFLLIAVDASSQQLTQPTYVFILFVYLPLKLIILFLMLLLRILCVLNYISLQSYPEILLQISPLFFITLLNILNLFLFPLNLPLILLFIGFIKLELDLILPQFRLLFYNFPLQSDYLLV